MEHGNDFFCRIFNIGLCEDGSGEDHGNYLLGGIYKVGVRLGKWKGTWKGIHNTGVVKGQGKRKWKLFFCLGGYDKWVCRAIQRQKKSAHS